MIASIQSIPQEARRKVSTRLTAEDLMELAHYTEAPDGVHAIIEHAPKSKMEFTAPTRAKAESAMRDFCQRLATHLNR